LTYEDREELIIAAVTGALIGFFGGYYLDHSRGVRHTYLGDRLRGLLSAGLSSLTHALPSSLPAALVCRGTTRLLCCARPRRTGARLCLFRGRAGTQIGRKIIGAGRGKTDCRKYRETAGAFAEVLNFYLAHQLDLTTGITESFFPFSSCVGYRWTTGFKPRSSTRR
jgi:hypothetical protein